ncbi:MAG: hypothetical protein R6U58_00165 [Bacteroidales bacterium]
MKGRRLYNRALITFTQIWLMTRSKNVISSVKGRIWLMAAVCKNRV